MPQFESEKCPRAPRLGQLSGTEPLSLDQATVRHLVSQLGQVPDIRFEQVDTLRSEIHAGKFQQSNEQVADAIVTQLLGINSKVQPLGSRSPS